MQLRWFERQELEHVKFLTLVHCLSQNLDYAKELLAKYFTLYTGQEVKAGIDLNDPYASLSEDGKKFLEQLAADPVSIENMFPNES